MVSLATPACLAAAVGRIAQSHVAALRTSYDRALASLRSRMTSRPLTGRAISSTLKPLRSSCGQTRADPGPERTLAFAGDDEGFVSRNSSHHDITEVGRRTLKVSDPFQRSRPFFLPEPGRYPPFTGLCAL